MTHHIFTLARLDRDINRAKALSWYHRSKGSLVSICKADEIRAEEIRLRQIRKALIQQHKRRL